MFELYLLLLPFLLVCCVALFVSVFIYPEYIFSALFITSVFLVAIPVFLIQ